ncbi:MAG: DUF4340 domain-containing protein [Candidatus Hydrogenedentes bacterium]|nr:DUF4340 domain-containing protein [Candidatus Hydrogenedentota bacterium]
MSKKGTLILLGMLAGLCVAYWGMVQLEKSGEARQVQSKKLFDFKPEDVNGIEILRLGEPAVAAERKPSGQWAITKPDPSIDPNQIVWDRAAKAVATLDNARTIETGGDLAAYGLDKPVLTFTATRAEGAPLRFEFGATDPTQAYRYARLDGQLVFLVSIEQFYEMDRSLDLLRDRHLFKVGEEGISRLEFSRFRAAKNLSGDPAQQPTTEESVTVAVEKQPDGHWQMVSPEQAPANAEIVESIIKEIQFSMIVGFIEQPESVDDYGINPPKARLTIYTAAGAEPQTVLIGSRSDQESAKGCYYAKWASRPTVFLMDPNAVAVLPQAPGALREGRLFTRDASKLKSIRYKTAEADFTLENDPEKGWRLVQPPVEDTDQVAVSNFIGFLKQLSGGNFPGDVPALAGFDNPRIAIHCEFRGEGPSDILVGGPVPDVGKFYARLDNGVTTVLNEIDVTALTRTPLDFQKKTLMEFDKLEARTVELKLDGEEYLFEKLRGKWAVTKPEGRVFGSSKDMEPLTEALSQWRADKKLADDPGQVPGAGLDAPVVVISVTAGAEGENPAKLGPVVIGAPTPDDSQYRYATSTQRPGVYLVRQSLVDEIRDTVKAIRKP